MSAAKQSEHDFRLIRTATATGSDAPRIDESQPRPVAEMRRAIALLQGAGERGGDPYNAVGSRIR